MNNLDKRLIEQDEMLGAIDLMQLYIDKSLKIEDFERCAAFLEYKRYGEWQLVKHYEKYIMEKDNDILNVTYGILGYSNNGGWKYYS